MNPFGIAPLLDREAYRLGPYERFLIAKIRNEKYCADLWDSNGLYLNYVDRIEGRCDGQRRIAVKSRYTMTAEQRRAWNNSYGDPALNAQRAKRAATEAERREEQSRVEREWAEKARREAERDAAWRQRAAEIEAERAKRWQERERKAEEELEALQAKRAEEAAQTSIVGFPLLLVTPTEAKAQLSRREAEHKRIMAAPWQCKKCGKKASIDAYLGGFKLSCVPCAESTFAEHDLLVRVVEAQAA